MRTKQLARTSLKATDVLVSYEVLFYRLAEVYNAKECTFFGIGSCATRLASRLFRLIFPPISSHILAPLLMNRFEWLEFTRGRGRLHSARREQ